MEDGSAPPWESKIELEATCRPALTGAGPAPLAIDLGLRGVIGAAAWWSPCWPVGLVPWPRGILDLRLTSVQASSSEGESSSESSAHDGDDWAPTCDCPEDVMLLWVFHHSPGCTGLRQSGKVPNGESGASSVAWRRCRAFSSAGTLRVLRAGEPGELGSSLLAGGGADEALERARVAGSGAGVAVPGCWFPASTLPSCAIAAILGLLWRSARFAFGLSPEK